MRSGVPWTVGVAWLALGCSASTSLTITDDNALAIASMALVERGHVGGVAAGYVGFGVGQPPGANCGGALTITHTDPVWTLAFDHCNALHGVMMNGTIEYTDRRGEPLQASIAVELTLGDMTIAESGSYALTRATAQQGRMLRDGSLHITISTGGTVRAELTLSDLEAEETTETIPFLTITRWSHHFELDNSRLGGRVSVATTTWFTHVTDGSLLPADGQLEITGGDDTRLVVTIAGDELSVPEPGKDQIGFEVDPGTGTLGAQTWMSWEAFQAATAM
jgi:hypothetical protein